MAVKVSAVVLTYNEADIVAQTLRAIAPAVDELLVVDSGSTDETVAIARRCGATVLHRAFDHWAGQRNWAFSRVNHAWILVLDADEVADAAFVKGLQQWKLDAHDPSEKWNVHRTNYFMGKRMHFSSLQTDIHIRLVHASTRYTEQSVHERIPGDRSLKLPGRLHHYSYKNRAHWEAKLLDYSRRSARDHSSRTPSVTLFHLWLKPAFRFIKHYLIRGGILDGRQGFIYSLDMAKSVRQRYLYLKNPTSS